ncbi:helix-turn-helix domain-containing protein [Isachenkonia alkalipeptolytica]|uniref:RepB-like DNA primase domain-containing protein n=1 Tax=Isachenkonia alkalipeptolytica TaxID=2565777 RepID=A0AA44BGX5_9CLOT|nr:helix-turn-helix domain-containing protein [Isachenkonia alkalipeptolytica]NBG89666.1 hypothetical protein [Isachenkonia alkalipeptolytica]
MTKDIFLNELFSNSKDLIEIREITSDREESKQHFFTLSQALEYEPPKDTNVYIGVYARAGRNGTARGCRSTGALWLDFDNMEKAEALERIERAGLPKPSIIINSGHGIHTYWILKQRAGNEALKLIRVMAENTGADLSATDKARIMRLPDTMNIKEEPIPCKVVEISHKQYKLQDIAEALEVDLSKEEPKAQPVDIGQVERPCIKAMLQGVGKGHRNFALGRITKYLQITKGFTKAKALGVVIQWNKNCKPAKSNEEIKADFSRYWHGDYSLLGCKIPKAREQAILSEYCNKEQCSIGNSIGHLQLDNSTKYNNRLFNYYEELSGYDLIAYGTLLKYPQGLNRGQLTEKLTAKATNSPCMTDKTLKKSLDRLKTKGLIEVMAISNSKTNFNNYFAKAKPQGTYGMGYTIVSNGAIMGAINKIITPGQLKTYVLLLKYAYSKGSCFPSTLRLAKDMRTKQPNVVRELSALEKVGYIEKLYNYEGGNKRLTFRLLI